MNFRQIAILILSIVVVIVDIVINLIPLGGKNTIQIIEAIPSNSNPFAATYFAWIVVWVGMIAFSLYQALPAQREKKRLDNLLPWYFIASVANIIWIILWHLGYIAISPVIMLILLLSLAACSMTLASNVEEEGVLWLDRVFSSVSIGFYFGWVVIMLVVTTVSAISTSGAGDFVRENFLWVTILMLILAAMTLTIVFLNQDLAFAGAILWGLFGIYSNNLLQIEIQVGFLFSTIIIVIAIAVGLYQIYGSGERTNANDYF